eukprot:bmy_10066T0
MPRSRGSDAVLMQRCRFWTPARDAGHPPSQAECVLGGQPPPALLSRGLSRGPLLLRASLGSKDQGQLAEQLPATSPLRKCEEAVAREIGQKHVKLQHRGINERTSNYLQMSLKSRHSSVKSSTSNFQKFEFTDFLGSLWHQVYVEMKDTLRNLVKLITSDIWGDLDYYWLDPATWHSRETSPISSHPVTWQPSKEGDRLIGRVILNKRTTMPKESGALLGLKVVGGKMTDLGRLGAFITKVKKGSLADVVGHLRAGDEVLEWNGKPLPGATNEEVYNIILESKSEPQVEIIVSRPIGDIPRIPESSHPPLESSSSSFESQKMERPSISVISPTSPGALKDAPQVLPGQLSVKLWYDKVGHQLIVNVLQATDLPPRVDGRPRNPYVKMYFLPDRSDKSKRRTKTVKKVLEPKWNQTFVYSHVHRRDFRERMLEITVWDQPRVQEEESEFLGEILIELETALLDDEPHWYKLQTHDESSLPLPQPSPFMPRRHVHGESASKKLQRSQRISDSDISDYEVDDAIGVVPPGYRSSARESKPSTLTVPEQQRATHHRSRSVSPHRGDDQGRPRSRLPNVPLQRSLDEIHPTRRSRSPTRHHDVSCSPVGHRPGDVDMSFSCFPEQNEDEVQNAYTPPGVTKCLVFSCLVHWANRGRWSPSLDRRRPPSPRIQIQHASPENDRHSRKSERSSTQKQTRKGTASDAERVLPPCLSRRGYAAPRATDQLVLRGKHPARSRSSEHPSVRTLCSMHHVAPGGSAPPSPLLTRVHRQASPTRSPPADTAFGSPRGRQLPQAPVRSGSAEQGIHRESADKISDLRATSFYTPSIERIVF